MLALDAMDGAPCDGACLEIEIISQDTADGHQCWTSFPLHL